MLVVVFGTYAGKHTEQLPHTVISGWLRSCADTAYCASVVIQAEVEIGALQHAQDAIGRETNRTTESIEYGLEDRVRPQGTLITFSIRDMRYVAR